MKHTTSVTHKNGFEVVRLKNDFCSADILVNVGNTLMRLTHKDTDVLYFPYALEEYKTNSKLAGNPFLHPFANRLEGEYIHLENKKYNFPEAQKQLLYRDGNQLPMHGLLLKSDKWQTIELYEEDSFCCHIAEFIFEEEDLLSIFQFRHKIQIRHQLHNKELKIETTILNYDEKEMPLSFGYHPYFVKNLPPPQIGVPAENVIEVDKVMIPTGNSFSKESKWNFVEDKVLLQGISFDDGFRDLKLNEKQQAVFSLDDIKVTFDEHYPFAQIYAPNHPEKNYVCIEPMTAPTNALNTNSCKKLKHGESFTASFSIML